MAKFLPYKFKTEAEATSDILPIREGQIIYVEDTQTAYLDFSSEERVAIKNITILLTSAEKENVKTKGLYYIVEEILLYYFTGKEWLVNINKNAETAIKDNLNQIIDETYIKKVKFDLDDNNLIFIYGNEDTKEINLSSLVVTKEATQTTKGLMSASDKYKLDNMKEEIIIDIALSPVSENPVQNKVLYNKITSIENIINGLARTIDNINGEVI